VAPNRNGDYRSGIATDNDAIFTWRAGLLSILERDYGGEKSTPWEAPIRFRARSGADRAPVLFTPAFTKASTFAVYIVIEHRWGGSPYSASMGIS